VLFLTLGEIGEVDRLELGEREGSSVMEQRLYLLDQIRSSKTYILGRGLLHTIGREVLIEV
jgi:hypothetical protein